MEKIKIFIADDYPLIINGLKTILSKEPAYKVTGEATDGLKALNAIEKELPDIIFMDINMPNMNGIEATKHIVKDFPDTKVIMLSMHNEQRYVLDAFRAGARGYILKNSSSEEILSSITRVMSGQRYASPAVASVLLAEIVDTVGRGATTEPFKRLTDREREVLKLIANGLKTRDIAEKLYISVHTAKKHRSNIMKKLDVHTVAALVRVAMKEGLA